MPPNQMKRHSGYLAAAALAVTVALPGASWADGARSAWERIRTEDGIVVSRKEVPGSPFVAFRGEGDVDAPLLAVANVLVDVPHEKEWIDSVVDAKILRRVSDTEYVVYSHLGTPVTMSDREFVADVALKLDPPRKAMSIEMRSTTDPSAPHTSFVRAELEDSVFALTSIEHGTKTHVVAEIHCDPKGSIAAWIVNLFQKSWGYNTIASLRRQVRRGSAPTEPHLETLLRGAGVVD
jgi:hypothetical protein